MQNTAIVTHPIASVDQAFSSDFQTHIVAWQDGALSIFVHATEQPEPTNFVKLNLATVRTLAALLQGPEVQAILGQ